MQSSSYIKVNNKNKFNKDKCKISCTHCDGGWSSKQYLVTNKMFLLGQKLRDITFFGRCTEM